MNLSCPFKKDILFICLLGFYISCTEPFPELPPETQSGEGTFGCLINNELVFARNIGNLHDANARYITNADQLQISAKCQFGQQFLFIIDDPYKKQNTLIDTVRYLPPNSNDYMEATQTGYFKITRIDNINNGFDVASGTFSFDLNETENTPTNVTKGRFDLNLIIY